MGSSRAGAGLLGTDPEGNGAGSAIDENAVQHQRVANSHISDYTASEGYSLAGNRRIITG